MGRRDCTGRGGAAGWMVLLLLAGGCRSSAGSYCQDQAECRAGLVCRKPTVRSDGGVSGMAAYGLCLPALLGAGQVCLRSDECEDGLRCSNEVGVFTGDELHGLCEPRPVVDAASSMDLAERADGSGNDGGDGGDGGVSDGGGG